VTKLFGLDIDKLVFDGVKSAGGLPSVTFTKVVQGARTAGASLSGPTETTTTHTGQGFFESLRKTTFDETVVEKGDKVVAILGASITPTAEPAPDDEVTIEGETLRIVAVETDPAKALWLCLSRG